MAQFTFPPSILPDIVHIFHLFPILMCSAPKRVKSQRSWNPFCPLPKILSPRTGPDTQCNYLWRERVTHHRAHWNPSSHVSLFCKALFCHLNVKIFPCGPHLIYLNFFLLANKALAYWCHQRSKLPPSLPPSVISYAFYLVISWSQEGHHSCRVLLS